MIGKPILHYRIIDKLGEGGMGIVYKAEDTKLNREVAIKILPPHMLVSEDDRARFSREAKAAAALNHSNIATVYEINEFEGKPFIVMEYVPGKTLNDMIGTESLLPIKEVISIVTQVAEGLKAAHNKSIIHRDIKPSNILVSEEKQAKILDFGLAKTSMSTKLTQMGTTIGTVAYMSPEQVKGQEVDNRTDLWSLGVVLYEMISGHLPFKAEYDQAIFYSIQNENPDPLTSIRTGVPMSLEWIVSKLMAKDPNDRYQSASDLIIDLKAVDLKTTRMSRISGPTAQRSITPENSRNQLSSASALTGKSKKHFNPYFLAIAFVLGVLITAAVYWNMRSESFKELRKFQWPLEYDLFALSPDGKKIAFKKGTKLFIRQMDELEPVEIKNENSIFNLFWSPNSENIAYFTGNGNQRYLKKVAVNGSGNSLVTKTTDNYFPRFWGVDDSICVTTWDDKSNNTLLKVSADGGELKPMYGRDTTLAHIKLNLTHVAEIPGTNAILLSRNNYRKMVFEIFIQKERKRTLLFSGPPESQIDKFCYSPAGFILYTRYGYDSDGTKNIWAIPFDPSSMKITGKEFLVARNGSDFSFSENGVLMYRQQNGVNPGEQLVLLSRKGEILKTISKPQESIYAPDVSPDGNYVVTSSWINDFSEIWIHDLNKNIMTQQTFDLDEALIPKWSPDGKKIVFQLGYSERADIDLMEINSNSKPIPLMNEEEREENPSWSPDGRYILYVRIEKESQAQKNIWYFEPGKENSARRLFQSRFSEDYPCMSPNGKFVAYTSNKSGKNEIYVTDFPKATRQWQVSFNGGDLARWVGNELFFLEPESNTLMIVKTKSEAEFHSDIPQKLFSPGDQRIYLGTLDSRFAITPDGKNIVAVQYLGETAQPKLVLVENWLEEFKDRIQ